MPKMTMRGRKDTRGFAGAAPGAACANAELISRSIATPEVCGFAGLGRDTKKVADYAMSAGLAHRAGPRPRSFRAMAPASGLAGEAVVERVVMNPLANGNGQRAGQTFELPGAGVRHHRHHQRRLAAVHR